MNLGRMNTHIDIISTAPTKDAEGFVTESDTILASVRAYKEVGNASEKWANMAQFATATALFRFRRIPKVEVSTTHIITDSAGRYNILSVDGLSGRGMYIEVITESVEGSS